MSGTDVHGHSPTNGCGPRVRPTSFIIRTYRAHLQPTHGPASVWQHLRAGNRVMAELAVEHEVGIEDPLPDSTGGQPSSWFSAPDPLDLLAQEVQARHGPACAHTASSQHPNSSHSSAELCETLTDLLSGPKDPTTKLCAARQKFQIDLSPATDTSDTFLMLDSNNEFASSTSSSSQSQFHAKELALRCCEDLKKLHRHEQSCPMQASVEETDRDDSHNQCRDGLDRTVERFFDEVFGAARQRHRHGEVRRQIGDFMPESCEGAMSEFDRFLEHTSAAVQFCIDEQIENPMSEIDRFLDDTSVVMQQNPRPSASRSRLNDCVNKDAEHVMSEFDRFVGDAFVAAQLRHRHGAVRGRFKDHMHEHAERIMSVREEALLTHIKVLEETQQSVVYAKQELQADCEAAHLETWSLRQQIVALDDEVHRAVKDREHLMAKFNAVQREVCQLRGERDALHCLNAGELSALGDTLMNSLQLVQHHYQRKLEHRIDEQLCVVCLAERKNVVLRPCNHLAVCASCSTRLNGVCPQCRTVVQEHLLIYS